MRRLLLLSSLAAALAAGFTAPAQATPSLIAYDAPYPSGTIVISQHARRLYLITAPGQAIAYPVAVAKHGKEWAGFARVDGKYVEPAWSPPDEVKRDNPNMPDVIPGGSPHNPMGARALTLDKNQVAIHGTTGAMRASVGTAASYGCIRMYNEDVIDLYDRVRVGATVLMAP